MLFVLFSTKKPKNDYQDFQRNENDDDDDDEDEESDFNVLGQENESVELRRKQKLTIFTTKENEYGTYTNSSSSIDMLELQNFRKRCVY